MDLLSRLIAGIYFVAPPVAALLVAWRARRAPYSRAAIYFTLTCASGSILGMSIVLLYAKATDSGVLFSQLVIAAYVSMGILFLLKGLVWILKEGVERLLRIRVPVQRRDGWWVLRATLALSFRTIVLFGLGLPYVMAVGMVYRPKVATTDTPLKQLGFHFEPVNFAATDGISLDGFWIPAMDTTPAGQTRPLEWGTKTVILCHGLGANKANQLALVRDLVPRGYNVLSFDFRAHGRSGGQISSFGDLEKQDVLGAVRWAQQRRPQQSKQILGLGISMGAAALVGASADDSAEGRAIDKVAIYDTFDDLGGLTETVFENHFSRVFAWVARHIALPIAGAHAGVDLTRFAPAGEIERVSPRPLLIIHARGDTTISFGHGVELFDRASQPKLRLWLGKSDEQGNFFDRQGQPADHNSVVNNNDAANAVRLFFEAGEPML